MIPIFTASRNTSRLDILLNAEAAAQEGTRLALIDGEVVEWGANLQTRRAIHGCIMAKLATHICHWLTQSGMAGIPAMGEARCRLRPNPETIVGIDAGVWVDLECENIRIHNDYFDGPPVLAVDIFSPVEPDSITSFRRQTFLDSGVRRVWQICSIRKTLTICQRNHPDKIVGINDQLPQDAALPALSFSIASLFPTLPKETEASV